MCQSLKKLNIYLLYDPAIPFLGIYPRKESICLYKILCTNIHIAAPFVAAKTGNNQMSISSKVNIFKYGIAIQWNTILRLSKKNELVYSTVLMNLKVIMLNEKKPSLKDFILHDCVHIKFLKIQTNL